MCPFSSRRRWLSLPPYRRRPAGRPPCCGSPSSPLRPRPGSLEYELRRALRHDHFVSLVLIRECAGGPTRRTDVRLAEIAAAIGSQIRATDLAIRRGAHDFWLVLPETADGAPRFLGERLRLALAKSHPYSRA